MKPEVNVTTPNEVWDEETIALIQDLINGLDAILRRQAKTIECLKAEVEGQSREIEERNAEMERSDPRW